MEKMTVMVAAAAVVVVETVTCVAEEKSNFDYSLRQIVALVALKRMEVRELVAAAETSKKKA